MLTEMLSSLRPSTRERLGQALIWIGILTWAPFLLLRGFGYRPSLLWFLPFHLLGVIGGSRLRAAAREVRGEDPPGRSGLRIVGHGLILLGVAVWLPYFYLKLTVDQPVEVGRFLPFHLTGVLSGVVVLVWTAWTERRMK